MKPLVIILATLLLLAITAILFLIRCVRQLQNKYFAAKTFAKMYKEQLARLDKKQ